MCYSAQVIQMARKLSRQLGIRFDYDEVEKLFFRRLDDPSLVVSRGFEANFDDAATVQERRIKEAIDEHRSRMSVKMEKDLFTQKTRLVNAQRSLNEKETKKAREDVRIATGKIETLSAKLSQLRTSEPNEEDNRIFPFVYAGVIVRKDGQNLLTPMRYHCRPAGKPAFYDRKFPGLYNARRDNLEPFTPSWSWRAFTKTSSGTPWSIEGSTPAKWKRMSFSSSSPSLRKPCISPASGLTGRIPRSPTCAALPPLPMSRRRTSPRPGMIAASLI
jgi:hypothetical protein